MGPRTVATKQDRNSCSGTSAGSRERSSWVGIPNYKRVLSHNQTKSSIYVSDTSRLVIRWDLVYKNMGQALYTERDPYSIDLEGPTCPSALRPNKLPLGGARVAGDGGAEPVAPTARHVLRQLHRRAAGQRLPGVASAALRDPRRRGGRAVRGRIPAGRRDAGGAVLRTRRPALRAWRCTTSRNWAASFSYWRATSPNTRRFTPRRRWTSCASKSNRKRTAITSGWCTMWSGRPAWSSRIASTGKWRCSLR